MFPCTRDDEAIDAMARRASWAWLISLGRVAVQAGLILRAELLMDSSCHISEQEEAERCHLQGTCFIVHIFLYISASRMTLYVLVRN